MPFNYEADEEEVIKEIRKLFKAFRLYNFQTKIERGRHFVIELDIGAHLPVFLDDEHPAEGG